MNRKAFKFKQFSIFQDKTAMKVGTDGVLLGAWTDLQNASTILDIGTGTGLIALMMAQRNQQAIIEAIEIDENAFLQAQENFTNAIFHSRLTVEYSSLQNFFPNKKYDVIVSNPPFFTVNDLVNFDARKQARQQEMLTFSDLLEKTATLLNKEGRACFIIPSDQKDVFCELALQNGLKLAKIVYVKGNYSTPIKRVLLEFSFETKQIMEETLIIEEERHQYTQEYIELTKDFYLKM